MAELSWPRPKDPNDVLDYQVDWADWLGADTISTSTWPTIPAGITKGSDSKTTTATTIWLSGGSNGQTYELTNRVVTAGGRTKDMSVSLEVRNR